MENEFLSNCMVVYVEREIADIIVPESIIDEFYCLKPRKVQFYPGYFQILDPPLFIISLLLLSFSLFLVVLSFKPNQQHHLAHEPNNKYNTNHLIHRPKWLDIVEKHINGHKIKVGLVNINDDNDDGVRGDMHVETVHVRFDHVGEDKKWEDFFPEWIDEDHKWAPPACPEIPMPAQDYRYLDVIVARVPCRGDGDAGGGMRDVFRLQVNLLLMLKLVSFASFFFFFPGFSKTFCLCFR
ncbi:putative UDP-glucuronate:xylan alpha-glucuronosyltransferase 4 [Citrus sinensis]|uniref:putative UDP-glucuronate:xylan alpha-glucuronosyltransferase 4 n=1 Tax=Citrus sinensis TaxID=2711 RepID=UPI0022796A90|nr:putative UDP-glucuronate:xylan alpha-glucuronosyltransferase 4 [Citrus sinensis]